MEKRWKRRRAKRVFNPLRAPAVSWRPIGFCFLLLFTSILYLALPVPLSADSNIPYRVSIEGIADRELKRLIENASDTVILKNKPPFSFLILQMRINRDIPRIFAVLRSRGFYGARVTHEIDTKDKPAHVRFRITPGPPYLLAHADIQIHEEGASLKDKLPPLTKLGLILGSPAKSKNILDTQERIKYWFRSQGFPFAKTETPKVIVDHAKQAVSVTYYFRSGERARFGSTRLEGLESVDVSWVWKKIPWKEGDLFNGDLLNDMKKRLNATGLFTAVEVKSSGSIERNGNLPIYIKVKERKHRTFKAGGWYKTDEGPGGKVSWEHRNFFKRGERLHISGLASGIAYAGEGRFRRPEFLRTDQSLNLHVRLAEDHPDAFTSKNITSVAEIERSITKETRLSAGIGYRISRIDQLGYTERFNLLGLPFNFDWDTSNDILNPVRGGRLHVQMTPYYDTSDSDLRFLKGFLRYSRYFQISSKPLSVFAVRGSLGSIKGAERDAVPADTRFYAGGGGSIRGYPFQSVGPLQETMPVGGRSLFVLSSEVRIRITDTIGWAVFLDGGSAFEETFPDFGETMYWGAGIGFRYYTSIGPLRLDLGFPLDRRNGIDDPFQVYVSIGQAF